MKKNLFGVYESMPPVGMGLMFEEECPGTRNESWTHFLNDAAGYEPVSCKMIAFHMMLY